MGTVVGVALPTRSCPGKTTRFMVQQVDMQRWIRDQAYAVVEAFHAMRVTLDFTPASMMAIDAYMWANTERGMARPGSLFARGLEPAIFAFGCYTGEVLRRARQGRWQTEGRGPEDIALDLGDVECWPMQRVAKRFHLGPEENLQHYVAVLLEQTGGVDRKAPRGGQRREPGPQPPDEALIEALAADRHQAVPAFAPLPGMMVTRPPTDIQGLHERQAAMDADPDLAAAMAADPDLAAADTGPGIAPRDRSAKRIGDPGPSPAPIDGGVAFIEDDDEERRPAPGPSASRVDPFAEREVTLSSGAGGIPPKREAENAGVTFAGEAIRAWAIAGPLIAIVVSFVWRANAFDWFDGQVTPLVVVITDAIVWLNLVAGLGYPALVVMSLRGRANLGRVGRVVLLLLSALCWLKVWLWLR